MQIKAQLYKKVIFVIIFNFIKTMLSRTKLKIWNVFPLRYRSTDNTEELAKQQFVKSEVDCSKARPSKTWSTLL